METSAYGTCKDVVRNNQEMKYRNIIKQHKKY